MTFGKKTPIVIKRKSTTLNIQLNEGSYMEIQANIVTGISGSIG